MNAASRIPHTPSQGTPRAIRAWGWGILWGLGLGIWAGRAAQAELFRVEVDFSKAPECEAFAGKAKAIAEEWYPRIHEILNGNDAPLPYPTVKISFEPMEGVAHTRGNQIRVAASWIQTEPNDYGMIVHELTHVVQNYRGSVFWLTEGIADYIRYERFEPGKQKWRLDPETSSYRQGYGIAGAFLAWLEKNKDPQIIRTLHAALRQGRYRPQIFFEHCGAGLNELWDEYLREQTAPPAPLSRESDVSALREGVGEIAAPGIPGPLVVFGERAFPVVAARLGRTRAPVVAAARWAKGRVVAFGHTGYFDPEPLAVADTARLLANALRWTAGEKQNPRVAVLRHNSLADSLRNLGFDVQAMDSADVICAPSHALAAADIVALQKFVRDGGGLVTTGLAWGWLQLNAGKTLAEHPGNRLLAEAGMMWADGYFQRTSANGFRALAPPLSHAAQALAWLENAARTKHDARDAAQAVATVSLAARSLPLDEKNFMPRLRQLQGAQSALPTPEHPLGNDEPLARLALTLQLEDLRRTPPEQVRAHPAAAAFPYAVAADAPRVTRSVEINTAVADWHSTGLYAAAGETIRVRTPPAAVGKGLRVRIGAHSDSLWHLDAWARAPEITTETPLEAATTPAANAFGGLIYIVAPPNANLGTVRVEIGGAVEAPHYVLGRTELRQWRDKLRAAPAPWAELESKKIIVTVPSTVVRALDDPEGLMRFWDSVLDSMADLGGEPRARKRPERIVADAQISAGYMHAGYPIMTHLDVIEHLVDVKRLREGDSWGFFHEIGHNHQREEWTFEGTGEVTNNLFCLYAFHRVCGRTEGLHPALAKDQRQKRRAAHLARPDFKKWQNDPFLALELYLQLQEAFGWEPFQKVFAEYRALSAAQKPKSDADKRDQWMTRFSQAVGKNLGPFFEAWGVPTSAAARASIAHLPPWAPANFPAR